MLYRSLSSSEEYRLAMVSFCSSSLNHAMKEDDTKKTADEKLNSSHLDEQNKADNKAGNVGGGGGYMAGEKAARTSLYWMRLRIDSAPQGAKQQLHVQVPLRA